MRMKFFSKEYQWSKIQSAPHSPETEIKCRPQAFLVWQFYRGLKHEHVTNPKRIKTTHVRSKTNPISELF